jgi:ribonuclease D
MIHHPEQFEQAEKAMAPCELVDNAESWAACREILRGESCLAVDLEANSLHAYRERVCLIQISVPGHDFIIDPLADFALDGLGELFADPVVEKIFHASEYDLILLKGCYEWTVRNLFDTMWSARILGYTHMGLARFLGEFYGVTLSKRYQKADWGARPLTEPLLHYAQMDTHFLLRLRNHFAERMEEEGCMEEAREIFANACRVKAMDRTFDPNDFWSIPQARKLPPHALSILRSLFIFRDREAKRRDVPPFKVLSNKMLLALAQANPVSMEEMKAVSALPRKIAERLGDRLLKTIEEGQRSSVPRRPKRVNNNAPDASDRFRALSSWRKEAARERGVESDVIMTRGTMWEIAERNPHTQDDLKAISTLGPCRFGLYADELVGDVLNGDSQKI